MSETMSTWDALKEACAHASDANQRIGELERSLSLARAVIEALPKCDRCETSVDKRNVPATHQSGLSGLFYCENCARHLVTAAGNEFDPLPYAAALLAWKEAGR